MKEIIKEKTNFSGENVDLDDNQLNILLEREEYRNKKFEDILSSKFTTPYTQKQYLQNKLKPSNQKIYDLMNLFIKKKMVQAIITTNFDRGIEKALENENISYITLVDKDFKGDGSSAKDVIKIFKPHGDINRGEIKATPSELETLDKNMIDEMLKIMNENIVIVIGYAGYDKGIQSLFDQIDNRYFPIFWSYYSKKPEDPIYTILQNKNTYFIPGGSADKFLRTILEKWDLLKTISEKREKIIDISLIKTQIKEEPSFWYGILYENFEIFLEKFGKLASNLSQIQNLEDYILSLKNSGILFAKLSDLFAISIKKYNSTNNETLIELLSEIFSRLLEYAESSSAPITKILVFLIYLLFTSTVQKSPKMLENSEIWNLAYNVDLYYEKRYEIDKFEIKINQYGSELHNFSESNDLNVSEIIWSNPILSQKIPIELIYDSDFLLYLCSVAKCNLNEPHFEYSIWFPFFHLKYKNLPKWFRKAYQSKYSKHMGNLFGNVQFKLLKEKERKIWYQIDSRGTFPLLSRYENYFIPHS